MEKRGVIERGWTPPEADGDEKRASVKELEDHTTTRLAKAAKEAKTDDK